MKMVVFIAGVALLGFAGGQRKGLFRKSSTYATWMLIPDKLVRKVECILRVGFARATSRRNPNTCCNNNLLSTHVEPVSGSTGGNS